MKKQSNGFKNLDESIFSCQMLNIDKQMSKVKVQNNSKDVKITQTNDIKNYEEAFKILIQGRILKKTNNKHYTQKYFRLTPYRLLYYTDDNCNQMQGCFNLVANQQIQLLIKNCKIILDFPKAKLKLKFSTLNQTQIWYQIIQNILIPKSKPKTLRIFLDFSTKFWSSLKISLSQFQIYADTFDIILFKSKRFSSTLQRFITNSQYDHIGILLKTEDQQILVLQATSSQGVIMFNWKQFKVNDLSKIYSKIAYRKLLLTKQQQMIQGLQKYLDQNLGKQYGISLQKLLRIKFKDEGNETFFCSQLVADVYIKFNILEKSRSRSSYWPKDFTGNLKLEQGRLSDLMQIDFL